MFFEELGWRIPVTVLPLRPAEVHVWRASLDEVSEALAWIAARVLSADERERAARLRFERDRKRFTLGRGILRILLGHYTRTPPQRVPICYGAAGKPLLAPASPPLPGSLQFNVSHSDALVLYALTRACDVGIDVEKIRPIPEWREISAKCFLGSEDEFLRKLPDEESRRLVFFTAWTRQEARLKAQGLGLGTAERNLPDERHLVARTFVPESGYVATLAVDAAVRRIVHMKWPSHEANLLAAANESP